MVRPRNSKVYPMRSALSYVVILASLAVAACAVAPVDKPIVGRISALPAIQHPADNPTSPAKVALGAQLFMDKRDDLTRAGSTAQVQAEVKQSVARR